MSERLTDEQLRQIRASAEDGRMTTPSLIVVAVLAELLALRARVAKLTAAALRVVDDIREYERVNNLAPNPPRKECWDSVADLVAALKDAPQ